MFNKKIFLAVSFSALVLSQPSNAVIGPIKITLNPTELSSNYFNEVDTFAPFSSEVYTQDDIKNSKATNIYDFLSQNTSLSLAPSSGNRFSKKISARGYGLTIGSHNLVVTLNGEDSIILILVAQKLLELTSMILKESKLLKEVGQ